MLEKSIVISVIIPIFNTPKEYFSKCIESIVNTQCSCCEIVVVDDGSHENNSKEYRKICEKYKQVEYFKKENGGVSSARNYGIRVSTGNYLAFVDADDIVSAEFLSDCFRLLKRYDSDIFLGTMKYDNIPWFDQGVDTELFLSNERVKSLKKCFLEISQKDIPHKILGSPCGKLYKKDIVLKIMFDENITHYEDQLFNRRIFDIVSTAVLVPNLWYIYNQNDFSAMHSELQGKYLERLIPFFEIWETMNEAESDSEIRIGVRARSIVWFYGCVNDIVANDKMNFIQKQKKIIELYHYPIFDNLVRILPNKYVSSKYERFKLFLIKKQMKMTMYFLVWIRRKTRKF